MKIKHLLVGCMAMAGLLTGCLSEPDFAPVVEGGIPINLDGSISQTSTKVNAQGFEDKDALGLYAVNYQNSNQTPGTLQNEGNQADHVKYIFDESNWKWNSVKPVYYKDVNTNVDLYVFYPYAEPASVSEYNFEVQKDQSTAETVGKLAGYEASDFMWAKVANVAPTESAIKVKLEHMMAGVHVILQEGTGFDTAGDWNLVDKKVLVTNTTRKASIDLATGVVTPIGEAQAAGIVMAPQSDGSFRAIVVPQTVAAATPLLSITIDGLNYTFKMDAACEYVPGKLSQFKLTVNRKEPSGEYEIVVSDAQIVDWTEDINTHEGEARQYYCVHCDKPGTLGRLIKADDKNPMKIKNLKVSGTISDEDFYFMRDSMAILEAVNLKESRVVDVMCSKLTLPGHNNEFGKATVFATREAGAYDDVIPDKAFVNKKSLYNIVLPEYINQIGVSSFLNSSISGNLVLPDNVNIVWGSAFGATNITSVVLPARLEILAENVFNQCKSLSGAFSLPETIKYIGDSAFANCAFTGSLVLPNSLEYIGGTAFYYSGTFNGGLRIPDKINVIYERTFQSRFGSSITGHLDLNNVTKIGNEAFMCCAFEGELVIPEGVTNIPARCFSDYLIGSDFTQIILPSTLREIGAEAFRHCKRLNKVMFNEGLISIGEHAFEYCDNLIDLELPSTLQIVQQYAFAGCSGITGITCHSTEPPIILESAIDAIPKDNFVVKVPYNSINRYATHSKWGQFTRISAYHDFSISRRQARALNARTSKSYILRAPANHDWSIKSKPEWVTVTPSSGTGKTEVTITFTEMTAAEASQISVQMTHPTYAYQTATKNLKGRAGEIVFSLDGKDYTTSMVVEQFDYQYGDGDVVILNEATKGDGVDIVFMGDCYDAADIAAGNYLADINEAVGHYFALEPYNTYRDYFNVYAVLGVSDDSGMGTLNTIKDAKFGSTFGEKNLVQPDMNTCFEYACKAPIDNNLAQTLIVLVENTTEYGGITYMYGDGTALACCPKSADAYPYDFRGIVQHEAGGHGFGKLADEYIYHNAFISTCTCTDGCGHVYDFNRGKANGWYRNLELTGDMNEVGWSHLIFHPKYSNVVDIYEGGYFHSRGVYRSEPTSCMNNNIPYYSAISRQAMVERVMEYAGETFDLEEFIAKDVTTASRTTKSGPDFMPTEKFYDNGKQYAPVYMGEKPDFLK